VIYVGSTITNCALKCEELNARLSFVSQFVITEVKLISAPVPAIVTIDPYGNPSFALSRRVTRSQTGYLVLAPTTIAFVQSMTLPPPIAKTKSTSCFLQI